MPSKLLIDESIVSVDWLWKNIESPNLIILNATISKITSNNNDSEAFQIPKARFFDIKNEFSDTAGKFPNTFPSEKQFEKSAQKLGINTDSAIIVYDEKGIYSSARAWWLFKAFGHDNIAVLNGGFPEWKLNDYPIEAKSIPSKLQGNFQANYQPDTMVFFSDILKIQYDASYTIVDARSSERFQSLVPEPREGLRSGNIPNSKNIPFQNLLKNNKIIDKTALIKAFEDVNIKTTNLVFSCGSGVTACILALGADIIGHEKIAVYDGSWTEYGSLITNQNNMHWTKDEFVAYTLLYAANTNLEENNKERNVIISKVDMQTFQKIHDEFDKDNDYQSIQKIQNALKEHQYSEKDIEELLAEIKLLFFADGSYDVMERIMYSSLKKILN